MAIDYEVENRREGPEKIPDEIIIKNLLTENGKQNAYIQELEHKISVMYKPDKKEMYDIKKDQFYLAMREKIKNLNETIARLRKDQEKLIIKNLQYEIRLDGI